PDRLDIAFTLAPKLKLEFRHARVTGYGSFAPRVERIAAVRQFVAESGMSEAVRHRMTGDASTRTYDRLQLGNKCAILMNSPRRRTPPDTLPVAPHVEYKVPRYDFDAFLIEAELLRDWYLPRLSATVDEEARATFRTLWREALQPSIEVPPTWVLRDFHSPN